jgi:cytoskeleton protein RodZ
MAESIGQQLRQARQARALTLEEVARATHVRVHYLQALEAGDLGAVPSLAQARGFLRIYAEHLGLDAGALLSEMEGTGEPPSPLPPPTPPEIPIPPLLPIAEREAEPVVDPAIAAAAFAEIGQKLRDQREVLGLSLDDVERHTHLRTFFLKALEAGDFDQLPSPVQGRGMLSNYAEFLGMNPEPLLLRFADGLQARLQARMAAARSKQPRAEPLPPRPPSALRRIFSTELLVGGSLIVLLVGFALWAAIRIFAMRDEQQPVPTAPSIAAVLLATSTGEPSPSPLPPTSTIPAPPTALVQPIEGTTPEAQPPPPGLEAVQVYITVRQRAWIRVLVDGEVAFEGRVVPGSAYQYSGEDKVEILTGNGAAIQVFFNQQDLGPMGLLGEVVHQVFTRQGVQTPTPTITVSPTATERPTRTPRGAPSSTPQGTPTP